MTLTAAQQRLFELVGDRPAQESTPDVAEQIAELTQRVDLIDGVLEDLAPEAAPIEGAPS